MTIPDSASGDAPLRGDASPSSSSSGSSHASVKDERPMVPRRALVVALVLATYVYSLETMVTMQYTSYAASAVGHHDQLGTLASASAVVLAVGKPLSASIAASGRGRALCFIAVTYSLGLALSATARNMPTLFAGQMLYAAASSGFQIVLQVVIADLSSLRRRGVWNGMLAAPYLVNLVVAGEVVQRTLPNWRVGYGMFAVIVPLTFAPFTYLLYKEEKQHGPVAQPPLNLDYKGLGLLTLTLSLFIVGSWGATVFACHLIPILFLHSLRTPNPAIPVRLLHGAILGSALIGALDFASFYLGWTYLYPFITVTTEWTPRAVSYFIYTNTLSLTAAGLAAGAILYATRRVKWPLFWGLVFRLGGVILMYIARASGTTPLLIVSQALPGLGGGLANVASSISAQAAAPDRVGEVSAMTLLLAEVGNVAGAGAATRIWKRYLPAELERHVPGNGTAGEELRRELFKSFEKIMEYPMSDPVRAGSVAAYRAVMGRLVGCSVIVSLFPPLVCYLLTDDVHLADDVQVDVEVEADGHVEAAAHERTPLLHSEHQD